jgi:hypothetical protein
MAVWSLASPLMSSPDEPVHVIKAAAVVRGEFVGSLLGPSTNPLGIVNVPMFYAELRSVPDCYHHNSVVPASCSAMPAPSSRPAKVDIYNARYPPLYYALVGLPSLLGVGDAEIYLMRLDSALLSALLIALAAFVVVRWSRTRLPLAGIVVAATPMVLYLGGTVNPAGFEAAAGIALWASGSVLVLEHLDDPPVGLLAVVAGSAATLALTRPISPFWLGLIVLALVAAADRRDLTRALTLRRAQISAAVVLVATALATAWILAHRSYDVFSTAPIPNSVPESTILETTFRHNSYYLPDMIGVFGWFDTWSPQFTYIVWYGLVALFGLGAAAVSKMRHALTLGAIAVAIVVLPVAISSSQVHRYGYTWAGKDTLVFAVGLPILGSVLFSNSAMARHRGRLTGIVCLLAFMAQVAAFFEMLRRYAVGTKGADFGFFGAAKWQPAIGLAGAFAAETVILAIVAVVTWVAVRRGPRQPVPDSTATTLPPPEPPTTAEPAVAG